MVDTAGARPRQSLSVFDGVAVLVGIVIGAGIFKFPSLVAKNVPNGSFFIAAWVLGGLVSLCGALCYAELATTYPHAGGDYHFLSRAYRRGPAFLFAWARLSVIQTGSIALHAFLIGDYAKNAMKLGDAWSSLIAAFIIVALTALNVAGLRPGKWVQNAMSWCVVLALVLIIGVGMVALSRGAPAAAPAQPAAGAGLSFSTFGMAMVFVMFTYGGWNEAAYLSSEIKGGPRGIVRVFLLGICIVTVVYVLINIAYLGGLGFQGVANSEVVAADLMGRVLGDRGAQAISLIVLATALTNMNGTMITGARTNYALGRDYALFSALGKWNGRAETPVNALLLQSTICLALVALGAATRAGFQTMVDYTSPVFWTFFLLTGASIFVLRRKDPLAERPFRVPLYPLTPLVFCAACAYMLYSSLAFFRTGALVGLAVLAVGVPLMLLARQRRPEESTSASPGEHAKVRVTVDVELETTSRTS